MTRNENVSIWKYKRGCLRDSIRIREVVTTVQSNPLDLIPHFQSQEIETIINNLTYEIEVQVRAPFPPFHCGEICFVPSSS